MEAEDQAARSGPLAWMARNTVAANLLMVLFIGGGLLMYRRIRQEVFPEVRLDFVSVTVPYPGATPEDVEQGVVLAVEEAVRGVDGVDEIRSIASEGRGRVVAELILGTNRTRAFNDIKSAVDRITSFPLDAEEPVVGLATNRRQVLSLILSGDLDRHQLRDLSERARDRLLLDPRITVVEVEGLPEPEISIEIEQETLRKYGLTPPEVARRVREASVDLPAGGLDTASGEVRVRITERRDIGEEFRRITLLAAPDGARIRLGDVAEVVDGFRDSERETFYNGKPAVRLRVFRVADQTPLEVSAAVEEFIASESDRMPESVTYSVWNDRSELFEARLGLLVKNGLYGLVLVSAILGLFLQPTLAFWVTLGIPISFLGAFLFLPPQDVSINMISLFAFLLALGIVVDDAIVVGESCFHRQRRGDNPLDAAITGARTVARPVVFAVLTTALAFLPLMFVPGVTGKFFANIPRVVLPILFISLVESLFILPAHLSHVKRRETSDRGPVGRFQGAFADRLEGAIDRGYRPAITWMLKLRYLTLATALAVLMMAAGFLISGRMPFRFLPDIESEVIRATVELPFGAPAGQTRKILDLLEERIVEVLEANGGRGALAEGMYTDLGKIPEQGPMGGPGRTGGHLGRVSVQLVDPVKRTESARDLTRAWREAVGELPDVRRMAFSYAEGPSAGADVAIELAHRDKPTLERAAKELAEILRSYEGVVDVDDGFTRGKEQLEFELKPGARALGITERELGRQVRGAFFGAEAFRIQRERFELRVYVRLPDPEEESLEKVESLILRTPSGGEVPLGRAAFVDRGVSPTTIEREDGRRVVDVTGDVESEATSGGQVIADLEQNGLPRLMRDIPGLSYELSGQQQEINESLGALKTGLQVAFLAMFALMAVAFRSYVQPLIIMFAIPFGVIGALIGHLVLGFDLSIISVFGLVALSGVVVNDSLVLIAAINDHRGGGDDAMEAVVRGGTRRFRPILLTSLTTFFGLMPMIFETSVQARFLIPMAISLGFGVLFVTVIVLVIVPSCYMVVEDARRAARKG